MATEWEEIKRLAADFQRAQLTSAIQRLSERNCIEIVTKLVQLKLLDIVFTSDGKEYVTPQHVLRELKDELYVHGGRANLADLAQQLNLDFSIVESRATELIRKDRKYTLVVGELIERDYLDRIGEEINEKLQLIGQLMVSDLTKQYGLPGDFMQNLVDKRLGKTIHGQADPNDPRVIFTQAFIDRQRSRIRGALSALTRPTQILNIINRFGLQENIFFNIIDELTSQSQLAGSVSGGRQDRAVYVPDIYSRSQTSWVDSFYKQNGYLEYDNLLRVGVADPQGFVRHHFRSEPLTYLDSCAVGKFLLEQIESAVDEALGSYSWVDVQSLLPSVCTHKDGQQLLQLVLKSRSKSSTPHHVFSDTIVMSDKIIQDVTKSFDPVMADRAEKDCRRGVNFFTAQAGKIDQSQEKKERKDERRKKAAAGKGGGGTQGRETKTKAVKKKYRPRGGGDDESGSEDDVRPSRANELPFLSLEEIVQHLEQREELQECGDEVAQEIAELLYRPLTKLYQEVAKSVFLSSAANSGTSRRKQHAEVQEKINGLLVNFRLFEKGVKHFTGDTQVQLSKYLLKSIGSDIVNLILDYMAQEHLMASGEDSGGLTHELRLKLITKLPEASRDPLNKLNTALNGKSTEDFVACLEAVIVPEHCDMIIKKTDKKKDRQTVFSHRQTLLEQLSSSQEPALALHLAVLILFQLTTHNIVHASGKFVPQILAQLEENLPSDVFTLLHNYQGLVIKQLTLGAEDEAMSGIKQELESGLPRIKESVTSYRKGAQGDD